jgi:hypothetical protein
MYTSKVIIKGVSSCVVPGYNSPSVIWNRGQPSILFSVFRTCPVKYGEYYAK